MKLKKWLSILVVILLITVASFFAIKHWAYYKVLSIPELDFIKTQDKQDKYEYNISGMPWNIKISYAKNLYIQSIPIENTDLYLQDLQLVNPVLNFSIFDLGKVYFTASAVTSNLTLLKNNDTLELTGENLKAVIYLNNKNNKLKIDKFQVKHNKLLLVQEQFDVDYIKNNDKEQDCIITLNQPTIGLLLSDDKEEYLHIPIGRQLTFEWGLANFQLDTAAFAQQKQDIIALIEAQLAILEKQNFMGYCRCILNDYEAKDVLKFSLRFWLQQTQPAGVFQIDFNNLASFLQNKSYILETKNINLFRDLADLLSLQTETNYTIELKNQTLRIFDGAKVSDSSDAIFTLNDLGRWQDSLSEEDLLKFFS